MKHTIELRSWSSECGDGCCSDYGQTLTVNGQEIDDRFVYCEDFIEHFLKALGITDYEILCEEDAE